MQLKWRKHNISNKTNSQKYIRHFYFFLQHSPWRSDEMTHLILLLRNPTAVLSSTNGHCSTYGLESVWCPSFIQFPTSNNFLPVVYLLVFPFSSKFCGRTDWFDRVRSWHDLDQAGVTFDWSIHLHQAWKRLALLLMCPSYSSCLKQAGVVFDQSIPFIRLRPLTWTR